MGQPKRERAWHPEIQAWELDLCGFIARQFDRTDPEDLAADLAQHLLTLKHRRPAKICNWEAFLKTALLNKARNWWRDHRAERNKMVPLSGPAEETADKDGALEDILHATEPDQDQQIALAQIWRELDPEIRAAWLALEEANGNQFKAAQMLGKHRNTMRAFVRKIAHILIEHGFRIGR